MKRYWSVLWMIMSIVLIFLNAAQILAADGEDLEPPVLHNLSFSPSTIDVTGGSQQLTLTAEVTDDLSGLQYGSVGFQGPVYYHYISSSFYTPTCPPENPDCNTYEITLTFPENIESGTWQLSSVYLRDNVTNSSSYSTSDLQNMGIATELEVISNPDVTGPTLEDFSLDPQTTTVDVSSGSAEVLFNFAVSDDISGFNSGNISCYSPYFSYDGYDYYNHYASGYFSAWDLDDNGAVEGVTVYIPQYSQSGIWTCYVYLYDKAQNYTYYSTEDLELTFGAGSASFEVTADQSDLEPPIISGFAVDPVVINTINSSDSTVFTVEVTDNLSGFNACYIGTQSPSGNQYQSTSISYYYPVDGADNQYYREKAYPQYSEFGEWEIYYLQCNDKLYNYTYYSNADLVAAGLPSIVKIEGIDTSSLGSGVVGTDGGTIESVDPTGEPDGILTLDVPPGALDEDTEISITRIGRFDPVDIKIGSETGRGQVIAEYDFNPDGLVFNSDVTITFNVDVTDLNETQRDKIGVFLNTDTDGDGIDDTFVEIPSTKTITTNPDGTVIMTVVITVDHFSSYAVILPLDIVVVDETPPDVTIITPTSGAAVQDHINLQALVTDDSAVASASFTILLEDGAAGQPIGLDDIAATYNSTSGFWELDFDTTSLNDGYYLVQAKAVDEYDNEGYSDLVPFIIRNWSVMELLPKSRVYRAGRTVPVKFSLNIAESSDPNTAFVYNEDLEIVIYNNKYPDNILQTSTFGDHSRDYRINTEAEHYITNFKTSKTPAAYTVEIYRAGYEPRYFIDSFGFETKRRSKAKRRFKAKKRFKNKRR